MMTDSSFSPDKIFSTCLDLNLESYELSTIVLPGR